MVALDINTAIDILKTWETELKGKTGPLMFDMGIHSDIQSELTADGLKIDPISDILILGTVDEEIQISDLVTFLEEVKSIADKMSKYRTYIFEGIHKTSNKHAKYYKKRFGDMKIDYYIFWGT